MESVSFCTLWIIYWYFLSSLSFFVLFAFEMIFWCCYWDLLVAMDCDRKVFFFLFIVFGLCVNISSISHDKMGILRCYFILLKLCNNACMDVSSRVLTCLATPSGYSLENRSENTNTCKPRPFSANRD